MTLQQYYSQKYNKAIRDAKQPLIISMPKVRRIFFYLDPKFLIFCFSCVSRELDQQVQFISFLNCVT